MELITYFFVSVISWVGLLIGYILMMLAPEEQKPGMKYFNLLNFLLFLLVVNVSIFFSSYNTSIITISLIFFVLFFFKCQKFSTSLKVVVSHATSCCGKFLSMLKNRPNITDERKFRFIPSVSDGWFLTKYQKHIAYIYFAIVFYFYSESATAFIVISIIIFLYGLVIGSQIFDYKKKKDGLLKLFYYWHFILLCNLLKLIF